VSHTIKKEINAIRVQVEVNLKKEGDYIIANCPALSLSSFGKTEEEARAAFSEALETFMEDVLERGVLEKALLDLGWSLRKLPVPEYLPPKTETINSMLSQASRSFSQVISIPG